MPLISVLVAFLVIILILSLINRVPLHPQGKRIMRVIVIVIGVLYLLRYIGYFPM